MYWLQHTYISSKARLDWAVHVYILRPQPPTQTIQSQTPTQILTVQTLNLFTHKQSLFPVPAYNFAQWIWCPSLKFTQIFKTYSLSNNYPNRDSSIQQYQSIITQNHKKMISIYNNNTWQLPKLNVFLGQGFKTLLLTITQYTYPTHPSKCLSLHSSSQSSQFSL